MPQNKTGLFQIEYLSLIIQELTTGSNKMQN